MTSRRARDEPDNGPQDRRKDCRERAPRTWIDALSRRAPKLRRGSSGPGFLRSRGTLEKALLAVMQTARFIGVSARKVDELVEAPSGVCWPCLFQGSDERSLGLRWHVRRFETPGQPAVPDCRGAGRDLSAARAGRRLARPLTAPSSLLQGTPAEREPGTDESPRSRNIVWNTWPGQALSRVPSAHRGRSGLLRRASRSVERFMPSSEQVSRAGCDIPHTQVRSGEVGFARLFGGFVRRSPVFARQFRGFSAGFSAQNAHYTLHKQRL